MAISQAKFEGLKPEEDMKQVVHAYEAMNPLKVVFKSAPTEQQIQMLIHQLISSSDVTADTYSRHTCTWK